MSRPLTMPLLNELTTRAAALKLAASGWAVLPTSPADIKNPGSVVGAAWQQYSTVDAKLVRSYWQACEGIALHTGKCGDHGVLVFDVDRPDLVPADWWPLLDKTPYNSTNAKIPKKGHYFFLNPPGKNFGNRHGGLPKDWGEIRSGNGVVIAPPSAHPNASQGGCYRQIRDGVVPPLPAAFENKLEEVSGDVTDSLSDKEVVAFLEAHNTGRKLSVVKGAVQFYKNKLLDDGEDRHSAMREALRIGLRDAANGKCPARRVTDALLTEWRASLACEGKYDELSKNPRWDSGDEFNGLVRFAVGRALKDQENQQAQEAEQLEDDLPHLTWRQIADLPPIEPIIEGWLDRRGAMMLAGKSKTNKSFITLDWMLCLATGAPWLGNRVLRRTKSLLIVGEGLYGLHQRAEAWREAHEIEPKKFAKIWDEYIKIVPRPKGSTLAKEEFWRRIERKAASHGAGLVVLDTLSSLGPDVAETDDAAMMIALLSEVAQTIDGLAILVHHSGWGEGGRPRGGSQYEANPDYLYITERVEGDRNLMTLLRDKVKDGPDGQKLTLRRVLVNSGVSVVLEQVAQDKEVNSAADQRKVYDAVAKFLRENKYRPNQTAVLEALGTKYQNKDGKRYVTALRACVAKGYITEEKMINKTGQPTEYDLGEGSPHVLKSE